MLVESPADYRQLIEERARAAIETYETSDDVESIKDAVGNTVTEVKAQINIHDPTYLMILAHSRTSPSATDHYGSWKDSIDRRGLNNIDEDTLYEQLAKRVLFADIHEKANDILTHRKSTNKPTIRRLRDVAEMEGISPHARDPAVLVCLDSKEYLVQAEDIVVNMKNSITEQMDSNVYLLRPRMYEIGRSEELTIAYETSNEEPTDEEQEEITQTVNGEHINAGLVISGGDEEATVPDTTTKFGVY